MFKVISLEADLFYDNKTSIVLDSKEINDKYFDVQELFVIENNFKKMHLLFFRIKNPIDDFEKTFCISFGHFEDGSFYLTINDFYEINGINQKQFNERIKESSKQVHNVCEYTGVCSKYSDIIMNAISFV